jgi:hypothetical protein
MPCVLGGFSVVPRLNESDGHKLYFRVRKNEEEWQNAELDMLADYKAEVYDDTVRACYQVTFASLGLETIELDEGNTVDICLKNRNETGTLLNHFYVSDGYESTYSAIEG